MDLILKSPEKKKKKKKTELTRNEKHSLVFIAKKVSELRQDNIHFEDFKILAECVPKSMFAFKK